MSEVGIQRARKQLSVRIERAYRQGETTVICKRGVPYARLAPLEPTVVRTSILELRGTGRDLYGEAADRVARLRGEWD